METIPQPIEISFPLPKAPHAILHCQLTFLSACSMIHLTTTELGQSGSSITPMGSLVYAIPDVSPCSRPLPRHSPSILYSSPNHKLKRQNQKQPISTPLCESGSSIEYATRVSKILARKTNLPTYVSCSMNFAGITPEEEMEGLTRVIEEVMTRFNARTTVAS